MQINMFGFTSEKKKINVSNIAIFQLSSIVIA